MAVAFAEDLDGVGHVGEAGLACDASGPDLYFRGFDLDGVPAQPADEMVVMTYCWIVARGGPA